MYNRADYKSLAFRRSGAPSAAGLLIKLACAALLIAQPLLAQGDETSEAPVNEQSLTAVIGSTPSNWRIGAALGYGVRTNPLIQSDDIPIVVDLDIAWFGERLFFDNGDVGFTVTDNASFTLSMVGRFNSDRVFFGKTDTRFVQFSTGAATVEEVEVKVPKRDYAIEAGAELLADGNWGRLQLTAFTDISGTHGGQAYAASYSYGVRSQRWYVEPSLVVSVKSHKLNDYYWGVRENEANELLPAYEVGSGANLALRVLGSYQITPDWVFSVAAEYEWLNTEAAGSPLVRDNYVAGFFAGFGYRF